MRQFRFRKASRVLTALAASAGALSLGSLAGSSSAGADPAWSSQSKPLVAVGSNTLEDLVDAYSGVAPTPGSGAAAANYHQFQALWDPNSGEQVYSWDAVNQSNNSSDCISAKPGFAPIARPNGSGDGQKAISDAIAGVAWSKSGAPACAAQSPTGQIDIGRSSSPPSGSTCAFGATNCLAWVDLGHDAVSYAYWILPGSGVTTSQVDHLSNATVTSIFTNANSSGTFTDASSDGGNGVTFAACLPQLGSGTEKFFVNNELNGGTGLTGGTATAEAAATASNCKNFEENGANTFFQTADSALTTDASDSPAPTVAITPFSVGSFIAQSNLFAFDRSSIGISGDGSRTNPVITACASPNPTCPVGIGFWDGASSGLLPYNGTSPNETPNSTFYNSALYGRDIYLEVNNKSLNGSAIQSSAPLRKILGFLGNNWATGGGPQTSASSGTGQICQAPWGTTVLNDFGFISPTKAACGAETITVLTTGNGS